MSERRDDALYGSERSLRAAEMLVLEAQKWRGVYFVNEKVGDRCGAERTWPLKSDPRREKR